MQHRRSFQVIFLLFSLAMFCAATAIASPAQTLKTLVSFNGTDGASPTSTPIQGSDGNFYGTTQKGGYYCSPEGCGTVFRITTSGALTTLHSFNYTDGVYPYVGLVQARDGNFYGTTAGGGAFQEGTVFQITPTGTLTTLYSSCAQNVGGSCTDGQNPWAPLVQARDRNLYGTTFSGRSAASARSSKLLPRAR